MIRTHWYRQYHYQKRGGEDYGAREKDKESELEKINVEKLAIRLEKESKTSGANTKGVNSELDKKSDKLKPIRTLKKQKFEMVTNKIINNKNIRRKVAENEKLEIKEVSKVQHTTGEVKLAAVVAMRMKNMRVKEIRKWRDVKQ